MSRQSKRQRREMTPWFIGFAVFLIVAVLGLSEKTSQAQSTGCKVGTFDCDGELYLSNGNVGIGTTDPVRRFQITRSGNNTEFSLGENLFLDGGGSTVRITNNAFMDAAGSWAISDPTARASTIEIRDFSDSVLGNIDMWVTQTPGLTDWKQMVSVTPTIIRLAPNGGYVGIGTTDPTYAKLSIFEGWLGVRSPSYSANTFYANARDIASEGNEDFYINWGNNTANVQIGGQGEMKTLTITGVLVASGSGNSHFSGNVGIGTATPADRLQVAGDVRVGTGTTGCLKDADGTVIAGTCSSDLRLKRDIEPYSNVLEKLTELQPVRFHWRAEEYPEYAFGSSRSFGLVAQDVEAVLPELVTEDAAGFKAVKYNELPFLMLQAIKELKAENEALKTENRRMQDEHLLMKESIEVISSQIHELKQVRIQKTSIDPSPQRTNLEQSNLSMRK